MSNDIHSGMKSSYFKVTNLGIYKISINHTSTGYAKDLEMVMPRSTFLEAFHRYTNSTATDTKVDNNCIEIGRKVWFIPEGYVSPYCGHVAGVVIDDFETGTTKYCVVCDGRYFFSKDVKVLDNVATSKEAAAYFTQCSGEQ